MFIKEEDASSEDICTTSVVREVPTDDIFEEVEDVSVTLLSFFCTLTLLYHLYSFIISKYVAFWKQNLIGKYWKECC